MHYGQIIRHAVRKKWHTPEEKEWWYTKLSAVRRRKMLILYEKQGGLCYYCEQMTATQLGHLDLPKRKLATLEHKKMQSSGGTDSMTNLVMACLACNTSRGDMPHEKFKRIRIDPVLWKAHMRQRSALFHELTRSPSRHKKKEKDRLRLQRFVCKLGVLIILCPEWGVAMGLAADQFAADKQRRLQEKLDRTEMDLLEAVEYHYNTD